jgi:hypothetical protein
MRDLSMDGMGAATLAMADMNMLIPGGLTTPDEGEVLPEAFAMANALNHRVSDFKHFFGDVTEGVRNIGSAAAVIAEIYDNADLDNAASVSDIGFVFSDPNATGPRGFDGRETWSEYEYKQAQNAPRAPMAETGGPVTMSYSPAANVTYYHYADGSVKMVTSSDEAPTSNWASGAHVVTTTVYGPGGQVVSSTSERTYSVRGSAEVTQTTVTRGDGQNGSTSSTTTSTTPDGTVTVTNQTSTTVDGQTTQGTPNTTVVHRAPTQDGEEGPVEDATEALDSYGQQHTVEEFGAGY